MKTRSTLLLAIAAASLAGTAQAALVKYTFTGSQVNEQYQDYSYVPSSKSVFINGTPVTISFFYDSSAPATATNFAPNTVGTGSNFGYMSKYDVAAKQFSGTIAGYQFNATAGRALVSNATQTGMRDGVFFGAGTPDLNFPAIAGSNFQGFQTGQFTLVGLNLWKVGTNTWLPNQSLPGSLTGPTPGVNSGLYLTFVNASQQQIWAQFGGSFTVTAVPVPAAAWLFGSALAGLAGARLRKNRNR